MGFLGTGVAVEPDSFLSQGKFNPARINAWLDPAKVPQWQTKSLTTNTTQTSSTGTGDPPQTPTRPPLWAWRTLQKVQIRKQLFNDDEVSSAELPRVSARRTFAATSMVAAPSSNLSATVAIAPAARFVQADEVTEQARIVAVDRAPIAMAVENAQRVNDFETAGV